MVGVHIVDYSSKRVGSDACGSGVHDPWLASAIPGPARAGRQATTSTTDATATGNRKPAAKSIGDASNDIETAAPGTPSTTATRITFSQPRPNSRYKHTRYKHISIIGI